MTTDLIPTTADTAPDAWEWDAPAPDACAYCGVDCPPDVRFDHDRFYQASETSVRARWAT